MQTKYIFMTGGVCSGLGKGITAASLGRLLKARGYKVTIQKFDPYINQDPGLLSPYQHGEVYVMEDGTEVDLDVGHYERFIDENLNGTNSVSAGKIYWEVLNGEKNGKYQGATIQVIPHITNAIKDKIYRASKNAGADIVISEIGGTVGDIESLPFLEAIRQTAYDVGFENVMYVHVTLIPYLNFADEMKTKPSQHSVKDLLSLGIKPDAVVCRTEYKLADEMREKLALYCNVDKTCVIENLNVNSIYEVPLLMEKERFADIVCKRLNLNPPAPDLSEWKQLVEKNNSLQNEITIGLVGKYTELRDSYLSVFEALEHSGISQNTKVIVKVIPAKDVTDQNAAQMLAGLKGLLAPGGFGKRDTSGIISAIKYARENRIPFLGIGLGMQCAIIEFARNVMNHAEADTEEVDTETQMPVVEHITKPYVKNETAPKRKGALPCKLAPESLIAAAYGESLIYERFCHLYKITNQYRPQLTSAGLIEAALSPDEQHLEAIELPRDTHPWFVGVQFHPEFKSRITRPHPLITAFVGACV
ncbi:MAG: CTP synthase [Defluviitaleaceae bacterium]|nr:CTP synthase [Defluviitaleaceae bacterium]MCL2263201.1 CTP synthase [Defluviitaleaceae bacterium]